jgi:hypothetical protein
VSTHIKQAPGGNLHGMHDNARSRPHTSC